MIATLFTTDHNPQVCDLLCVVEVVVRLSKGGPLYCPARRSCKLLLFGYQGTLCECYSDIGMVIILYCVKCLVVVV